MKRKFQPYDKQKLLAQIDLISIELVENQVITKWGSTVLSVTQVSNRYEVFDIKSYLKSKIDLIEKNFQITKYYFRLTKGVQELTLLSDTIKIEGVDFHKSFFILNSSDKSRRLSFNAGLYCDSKDFYVVSSIKNLGLTKKHLKGVTIAAELASSGLDGESFDEVTDPEFRYRQRYADLIVNPGVKETFIKRTKMVNAIRDFLNERGALEVDTPVLQSIPGGAAARPFNTHHNALDVPMYMRIANELYLKRLIVGGFEWVYEFSRNFRNEGMDRTHNPEFTVLEFYVAYKDYEWMMETTEQLLEKAALATNGSASVLVGDKEINFKAPYKRISMYDSIAEFTGFDISEMDENGIREVCTKLGIHADAKWGKGKLIDEIFGSKCEGNYIQPTFITDYPVEMSPLTKKHRSKPGLVERFELMCNGKEIANAYSELNDPIEQRERFEEQVKLMERGDDEAMFIDHDFLRALEYGMPPTSGIGFGIDRIAMLLTNQHSIQDVLLFPMMRPENFE